MEVNKTTGEVLSGVFVCYDDGRRIPIEEDLRPRNDKRRVLLDNFEDSRTRQEFVEECNINNIIRKYRNTGMVTHTNTKRPQDRDNLALPDTYLDALNIVLAADSAFMDLPASERDRYGNDPVHYLNALDEERIASALAKKEAAKAASKAPDKGASSPPAGGGDQLPS